MKRVLSSLVVLGCLLRVQPLSAQIGSSLVGCWDMNAGSGATEPDQTASANDLANNGTVGTAAGIGGVGASRSFGGSDWLTHASNATLQNGGGDFTVQAWVYQTAGSTTQIAAAKGDASYAGGDWYLGNIDGNGLTMAVFHQSADVQTNAYCGPTHIAATTWYHLVGVFDSVAQTVTCYSNGTAGTPVSHTVGVRQGTVEMAVGALGSSHALPWIGRVDVVSYWKSALTAGNVTSLYNSGSGVSCSTIAGGGGSPTSRPCSSIRLLGVGCEDAGGLR